MKRRKQLIYILFLIDVVLILFGTGKGTERQSRLEIRQYPTIAAEEIKNDAKQPEKIERLDQSPETPTGAYQDTNLQSTSRMQIQVKTTILTQSLTDLLIVSITFPISTAALVLTALNIRREQMR